MDKQRLTRFMDGVGETIGLSFIVVFGAVGGLLALVVMTALFLVAVTWLTFLDLFCRIIHWCSLWFPRAKPIKQIEPAMSPRPDSESPPSAEYAPYRRHISMD